MKDTHLTHSSVKLTINMLYDLHDYKRVHLNVGDIRGRDRRYRRRHIGPEKRNSKETSARLEQQATTIN